MPYKNKEERAEAVRRHRRKGLQGGITETGITGVGITKYPAIVEALANPEKRRRLERICEELGRRGLEKEVRFGVAGPTFDVVGELLDITH